MAYKTSYLIAKDELDLAKMNAFRDGALIAGIARAIEKKVSGVPDELVVRGFSNALDVVGIVLDQWNTNPIVAPLATPAVPNAQSVFQAVAAPALANNKLAVFYKVGVQTAPCPVGALTFRSGGAAGNINAIFDLEQIANCLTPEGYFSEPIVWDPTIPYAAQVSPIIVTNLPARVQLGGFLFEPKGQTIAVTN